MSYNSSNFKEELQYLSNIQCLFCFPVQLVFSIIINIIIGFRAVKFARK
jgi:hypothetical protein